MKFWQHFTIIATHPASYFPKVKKEILQEPLLFYSMMVLLSAIPTAAIYTNIMPNIMPFFRQGHYSLLYLLLLVGSIASLFLSAGIYHGLLRLFKGKGKYADTVKAYVYGSIPGFIWGIIASAITLAIGMRMFFVLMPVSIAVWIYSVYLTVNGFSLLHKVSTGKALLSYFLPLMVMAGLLLLVLLMFLPLMLAGGFV